MGGYSDYNYSASSDVVRKSVSSYNVDNNRSYTEIEKKKALPSPIGKIIQTSAKFPIVIATDVTGSMRRFPKLIFEKLCMLYNEAKYILPKKLKEDFEISFSAIGDAYCDRHPIQITDFAKEEEVDTNIDLLYPEGGGGGQIKETYELVAYYYLNKCNMKPAKKMKPLLIFIGDESYYPTVNHIHIRNHIGDDVQEGIDSKEVFRQLQQKYEVYILRLEYQDRNSERKIHKQWIDTLGYDHVLLMKDPQRVVDIILGIIAHHVNGYKFFKERLEIRQTQSQVDTVYSHLDDLFSKNKNKENNKIICEHCGAEIDRKIHNYCPTCGSQL